MTFLFNESWSVRQSWSGETRDVADARRFVDERLAEHGLSHFDDDVRLVASELVTNALRHAPGPLTVELIRSGGRLELHVHDRSEILPMERLAGSSATGGRGLRLVAAYSVAWGARANREGGKSVWATFDLSRW